VLSRKLNFLAAFLIAATTLQAAEKMPLSQIQKGMKGYGLTVFEGNEVEKFDVEILGVLNNIGPDQNLILAKVDHPVVNRAGVIAGMSGSPIFIDGKVIGALAYAWQFSRSRSPASPPSTRCSGSRSASPRQAPRRPAPRRA